MTDTCDADNREGDPCGLPAGWGTDHVGEGRCKLHGGASPRGEDHPHYETGAWSKYSDHDDDVVDDVAAIESDLDVLELLRDERLAQFLEYLQAADVDDQLLDMLTARIQSLSNDIADRRGEDPRTVREQRELSDDAKERLDRLSENIEQAYE